MKKKEIQRKNSQQSSANKDILIQLIGILGIGFGLMFGIAHLIG